MKTLTLALAVILCGSIAAHAGPFTDEMSRCIVRKTTESDKTLFIKWIYAAMSSHPDVASLANVSPELKDDLNKNAAKLVMELLTVRCKEECQQAVEFEGEDSFKTSFGTLGRVAMQGLMSHPDVAAYLSGLERYFDEKKLKKTFKRQ